MTIPSKYAGQCVALVDDKVIASGKTSVEAFRLARQHYPQNQITLMRVPTKKEVLAFL
ncbi:TPA: phosphoribosyltransferase [Candidatus Woesearchaeota archaeon]|nr:phosphoribosyltransferase [Candidatus Woesearchaeota archaeon]|tara:strand:- start:1086 stop:1259 length:174 start_codon:yes stop_codon:yes gene_type:complete